MQVDKSTVASRKAEPFSVGKWISFNPLAGRHALRLRFHSETHKLCWLAPTILLQVASVWLLAYDRYDASALLSCIWLAWGILGSVMIGLAIDHWGERFLFFNFSRNVSPSALEQRILALGAGIPMVLGLILLVLALIRDHGSIGAVLMDVGVAVLITLMLMIPSAILVPFLVIVSSGFTIRPVTDDESDPSPA